MNLDDMIARSIVCNESGELKQKLAANLIVVGGPANAKGLIEVLEDRVLQRIKEQQEKDGILLEH